VTISAPEAEARPGNGGALAGKLASRQPPWEKEMLPSEGGSFGEWLRRQREMREIGLRDIAERTKISLRYLEAMENDRFDLLPAPIFAKGFLREYARYVGLSPDEVVNHYLAANKPDEPGDETRARQRARALASAPPPMRRAWSYGSLLALAGLVLLILVAVAAHFVERRRDEPAASQPASPIAAPPPAAVPPAAALPAAAPSAPLEVALDFSQDCWIEAVIDGKQRLSELRIQGEALQLEAKSSVSLTLGNAAGVAVHVNGFPLELVGRQGNVVRDFVINLDTVKALREKRGSGTP
jgi:cytoskeletal protein RodZ